MLEQLQEHMITILRASLEIAGSKWWQFRKRQRLVRELATAHAFLYIAGKQVGLVPQRPEEVH